MVRKTFILKLLSIVLLIGALFFIVTLFMKPASGKNTGLAIGSFISLPIALTLLVKADDNEGVKNKLVKKMWFIWALVAITALVLVLWAWWGISHWQF